MDNVATEKANTTSEKLTDAAVNRLVGHTNVVYYNFETGAWNTNNYNGYKIPKQERDTERAQAFKVAMDKMPKFGTQYEMAASVTMTMDRAFYNGRAKPVSNPPYSRSGAAVVGNIIVKNKTTGRYELYGKYWVGVIDINDYCNPDLAVRLGAYRFADYGAWYSGFRAALIGAHTM